MSNSSWDSITSPKVHGTSGHSHGIVAKLPSLSVHLNREELLKIPPNPNFSVSAKTPMRCGFQNPSRADLIIASPSPIFLPIWWKISFKSFLQKSLLFAALTPVCGLPSFLWRIKAHSLFLPTWTQIS